MTLALAYKLDEARQRNVLRSLDPEECYPILLLFFLPLHGKPFLEILKTALGVFYSEVVNEALPGSSKSLTKPGEEESSGTISQATFLYNYRARYFDPSQGRFLQTDPLGYQDSMNLYQGMNMNPVNFVDPKGEDAIQAELGKHDLFTTQRVKTGKWWLDLTVVGAFNEVRNAAALTANIGANLLGIMGDVHDLAVEQVDEFGVKLGISNPGNIRDFVQFSEIYFMVNASLVSSSWQQIKGSAIYNVGIQTVKTSNMPVNYRSNCAVQQMRISVGKFSNLPLLRQAYVTEVISLKKEAEILKKGGMPLEEVARTLHARRREIGIRYKELTPALKLDVIYKRNLMKYGDQYGPTIEYLRSKGNSWEDIIESASRPGGTDLGY